MTRYEVLERIGAGRMAEIFRGKAIAAGGFEKPVAIKRILPHLSSDPRFVELLIAEAKILSILRHRNVVQIFDVGVGDDGHHFLVMEFVDGVDLGALQRNLEKQRQRLPIDLVLHIGAEVCEALDHAQHAIGPDGATMRLVHRDVTPTNVLVSRAGEVKLTDFGLAKRPEDGTSAGGLRGRFGYVSPEQASGTPVDGRADVFAVAVIMWELALGRRLFSGLADFEALRAVREGSIAHVRDLDPSLPADLDTILVEALARDPDQRLPNPGELGKRLRGLRYSLDDSSGDPAAALARLVVGVERSPLGGPESSTAARASGKERAKRTAANFDVAEPTVLRIRTADTFADVEGTGLSAARRVLDTFEEEQTRMSRLPDAGFEEVSTASGHRPRSPDDVAEAPTFSAPMHLDHEPGEIDAALARLDGPRAAASALDDPPREPRRPPRRPATRANAMGATSEAPPARPTGPPPTPPAPPSPLATAPPAPPPPARASPYPPKSSPAPIAGPAAHPALIRPEPAAPPRAAAAPPRVDPPSPYPRPVTASSVGFSAFGPPAPSRAHPRPGTAHPLSAVSLPAVSLGPGAPRNWWPIAIAAVVIAALSFLITHAALAPDDPLDEPVATPAPDAPLPDSARAPLASPPPAAVPLDAAPAPLDAVPLAAPPDAAALDDAAGSLTDPPLTNPPLTDTDTVDAGTAPAQPTVAPTPPRKKPPARKPVRKKPKRPRRR